MATTLNTVKMLVSEMYGSKNFWCRSTYRYHTYYSRGPVVVAACDADFHTGVHSVSLDFFMKSTILRDKQLMHPKHSNVELQALLGKELVGINIVVIALECHFVISQTYFKYSFTDQR